MLSTPVGRLRLVGLVEGMSFLLLLFVAMPLKYWANIPEPVTIVGSAHGGLWVLYLLVLADTTYRVRWNWTWVLGGFVASVLPWGPFVFDRRLVRFERQESGGEA